MKKILNTFLALGVIGAMLAGCHKELSSQPKEINSLELATDMTGVDSTVFITPDSINIKQDDSLKVKLKISQSLASSKNLSYRWMITQSVSSNANPAQYVVGTSAALAAVINLPPNLYRLVAKVTDNSTGVSYFKFFQLNIFSSPWGNEGWVVLQEQSAKGGDDVGVITTRDGSVHGQVYNNVYSLMNNHKLPLGTYKVNVIDYPTAMRTQKVSFFYPGGGLQVRSYDFLDSVAYQNWTLQPPTVTNLQLNSSMGGNGSGYEFVINNNQISFRAVNPTSIKTPPIFFGPPFLGTFTQVAPFVIDSYSPDYYVTLYDQTNHCFFEINVSTPALYPANPDVPNKHLNAYPTTPAAKAALNPTTGSGFDMNNMKYNMIYAENAQPLNASTCYWNTFFRNNTSDTTWLVQFPRSLAYSNNFTTGRSLLTEANCPGINEATQFACATSLAMPGGAFYYVNGNNIYTTHVGTLSTSTATVGLSFAQGTIIKAMKVFNSGYATVPSTEGKVLVVATDETANGKGNNVYFFNLDLSGNIIGTPATPADFYTGFDKINDIAFKKALGK